jgi:RNA polymerase primary sigma factor
MEAIRVYIDNIKHIPLLSAEEERDLFTRLNKGEDDLKNRIINSNLKLVVNIAKHYTRYNLALMDLIEEGNLGLIRAVERFEVEKGFRFSTYAAWWIKQAITRALIDQGKTIRVPVYMSELMGKVKKAQEELRQKNNLEPSRAEVAKKLGMTVNKIAEIEMLMNKKSSLEAPVGEDGESQLGDFIEDESSLSIESGINKIAQKEQIEVLLDNLPDREREVIDLRFGVTDGVAKTLAEIAEELDISRERVRQIEEKALRKLRQFVSENEGFDFQSHD